MKFKHFLLVTYSGSKFCTLNAINRCELRRSTAAGIDWDGCKNLYGIVCYRLPQTVGFRRRKHFTTGAASGATRRSG